MSPTNQLPWSWLRRSRRSPHLLVCATITSLLALFLSASTTQVFTFQVQPLAPLHSSFGSTAGGTSGSTLGPTAGGTSSLDRSSLDNLPLSFEPNEGQIGPSVRFLAHAPGGVMFFTTSQVVLSLSGSGGSNHSGSSHDPEQGRTGEPRLTAAGKAPGLAAPARTVDGHVAEVAQPSVIRMSFIGASSDTTLGGGEQLPGKVNYLIGNDPSRWHTNLPTYSGITYRNLYPGIDLSYSGAGSGGQLKGTYTLAPGADPSLVRWSYAGTGAGAGADVQGVTVDAEGNLQIHLAANEAGVAGITLAEKLPVAWQQVGGERVSVQAAYSVAQDGPDCIGGTGATVSFSLGAYDPSLPLTIDPTLTYSTYLGGASPDYGQGIAADSSGNAYISGATYSTNFPTANPLQPNFGGGVDDAFVSKLNPSGSALIYSTYLGGSGEDIGYGIAVDGSGNAYVTGKTYSANFPTANPLQPNLRGVADAFVSKLNPSGSALIYSTYLGGSGYDVGLGISVNSSGNAYISGATDSANFPTANPLQPNLRGVADAFVSKLNPAGSFVYSTYLGGSGYDLGQGIVADGSGNAYVTGWTESTDFPTANPLQPNYGGGYEDAFVSKLNPQGSAFVYSTYLGGTDGEYAEGIAADSSGNAYVTGGTGSTDFPTTNPFQPTNHGSFDAFVSKLNPAGSAFIYSTYLGGTNVDYGYGIAVDGSGNAYVTGWTQSTDFPTANPLQPNYGGGYYDAFVSKLNPAGSAFIYSTYLGGTNGDGGSGIAADGSGNAYVTGTTRSTDFPTANPLQPNNAGDLDAFVARISLQEGGGTPTATATQTATATVTAGVATSTPTHTPCPIQYPDVPPGSTFYQYINCLACRGIVSGYPDGTFGPDSPVTRGQLAKMVSNAAGYSETYTNNTFEDVPFGSTFFQYVERVYARGLPFEKGQHGHEGQEGQRGILGYPCGGPGEACIPPANKPYFRPGANVTRGQTSKIVAIANGQPAPSPGQQSFEDVAPNSTFWQWIEPLAATGAIGGYPCGGPGEPCNPPNNRPYFRPGANVTRGQSAKIVSNTFFPGCESRVSPSK